MKSVWIAVEADIAAAQTSPFLFLRFDHSDAPNFPNERIQRTRTLRGFSAAIVCTEPADLAGTVSDRLFIATDPGLSRLEYPRAEFMRSDPPPHECDEIEPERRVFGRLLVKRGLVRRHVRLRATMRCPVLPGLRFDDTAHRLDLEYDLESLADFDRLLYARLKSGFLIQYSKSNAIIDHLKEFKVSSTAQGGLKNLKIDER